MFTSLRGLLWWLQQYGTILKDACVCAYTFIHCTYILFFQVDGAIHKKAGVRLKEACKVLNGCEVGDAKLTPGFGLPAKCKLFNL